MRLLYVLLFITAIPVCLQAQNSATALLPTQLKKVLAAAPTDFKTFRGEQVKENEGDIIYASTITLQGTTDNQVMNFTSGKSYLAKLGTTTSIEEAQALIDTWKKKVAAIVGSSYEVMKDDHSTEENTQKGYLLISDKLSISIHAIQYKEEESINAFLLIMRL